MTADLLEVERQSTAAKATLVAAQPVLIFRNAMLPRSETFILAQARALQAFQPVLAAVHPSGGPALVQPGETLFVSRNESTLGELSRRWYWQTGVAPRFHRRLRAMAPRLIHAHFAPDGAAALPLQRSLGVPLVVTLHGYDVTRTDSMLAKKPENRLYLARRKQLWQRASLFLCVSNFIREQALARGFPETKLLVLPIGIDVQFFRSAPEQRERNLVVFVGRLVAKKGCLDLMQAMRMLVERGTDVRAVFIGDGPLRETLEQEARSLQLPCEFVGMQPPAVVRQWLQRARVFCVPSKTAPDGDSEGLGMVFAEAQATAVPVVSYRHGGIPEIVEHGVTGLLAPEGDVPELATALAAYLENDALCREHGLAGMRRMQQMFSLAQQTRKLEAVYVSVIDRTPKPNGGRPRCR